MSFEDEHGIPKDEETPAEQTAGNEDMDACMEALQDFVNLAGKIKRDFGLTEQIDDEETSESEPIQLKKKATALSAMTAALGKER